MTTSNPRHGRASCRHAAKVHQVWPELFTLQDKKLSYFHYKSIAVSSLEPHQKNELREVGPKQTKHTPKVTKT